MDALLDRFENIRAEFIDVLDHFPDSKRTERLFNDWNLKEVVAHLAGWDRYFTEIADALEAGEEPPYWKSMTRFNEASVEKRKDEPWDSVFKEFVSSGEAIIHCYKQLPASLQDAKFWKNKSYTPVQMLEINIHHYENDHLAKIKKVLARLE